MGQHIADPHGQQAQAQLQADVNERSDTLRGTRQGKCFQGKRRKSCKTAEDTDEKKKAQFRREGSSRLRHPDQKSDNEAAKSINCQGTVGKPRIIENLMHPSTQSIATHSADESTTTNQTDASHSALLQPSQ